MNATGGLNKVVAGVALLGIALGFAFGASATALAADRDAIQAPRSQDTQAPRGDDTQAPRGQDMQAPRGEDARAPRGEDTQAPRG